MAFLVNMAKYAVREMTQQDALVAHENAIKAVWKFNIVFYGAMLFLGFITLAVIATDFSSGLVMLLIVGGLGYATNRYIGGGLRRRRAYFRMGYQNAIAPRK